MNCSLFTDIKLNPDEV